MGRIILIKNYELKITIDLTCLFIMAHVNIFCNLYNSYNSIKYGKKSIKIR
jgi:hypothetical protein